ncbi:ATP-binding protein [Marinovum sp. PR37]|uniref:ATP-binding protein n=1 Tax=Marinovum sp. PR37 TaxID=3028382 RepID=UPI00237A51B1|nr:ATP-binding protein [Marinovum sp. PR37]MDD9746879.1 ATP-binding protein [Marinovum sp. PR37]
MIHARIENDDRTSSTASGTPSVSAEALDEFSALSALEARLVRLEERFEKTATYHQFRRRVFGVLASREARMRMGKSELKGAMLIGAAGAGKSRIVHEIIKEHNALTKHAGDWMFGTRILSVVVPGRSTVKETLNAILRDLGHPARGRRDEDYLSSLVMSYLKECRIAAIHLDEVQDSGRYKTKDSVDAFLKIFRNMMQHKDWPVCLIMTATPEAEHLINGDTTLQRRLKPMEMRAMTFEDDGQALRETLKNLLDDASLADPGILSLDEFIKILIHTSAGRFGVAVEMAIEAIGECLREGSDEIDMGHFADAYEMRMDCDEELNPFVSKNWSVIDTLTALQRYEEERQVKRRRKK